MTLNRMLFRAAALVMGGCLLVGPTASLMPAFADGTPQWRADVRPTQGDDDSPLDLLATGGCPSPASNVLGKVFGAGLPDEGVVVIGNTAAGVRSTAPIREPVAVSMREVARAQPHAVLLAGHYRFVLTCRLPDSVVSYGEYVASIRFRTPTSYVVDPPLTTLRGNIAAAPSLSGSGAIKGPDKDTGSPAPSGLASPLSVANDREQQGSTAAADVRQTRSSGLAGAWYFAFGGACLVGLTVYRLLARRPVAHGHLAASRRSAPATTRK